MANNNNIITTITAKTHRDVIRRVLDRKRAYLLSTYVRMIRKETGRSVSKSDVTSALTHMSAQGIVCYDIDENGRVHGFTLKTVRPHTIRMRRMVAA